jgi:hypothetical protein
LNRTMEGALLFSMARKVPRSQQPRSRVAVVLMPHPLLARKFPQTSRKGGRLTHRRTPQIAGRTPALPVLCSSIRACRAWGARAFGAWANGDRRRDFYPGCNGSQGLASGAHGREIRCRQRVRAGGAGANPSETRGFWKSVPNRDAFLEADAHRAKPFCWTRVLRAIRRIERERS